MLWKFGNLQVWSFGRPLMCPLISRKLLFLSSFDVYIMSPDVICTFFTSLFVCLRYMVSFKIRWKWFHFSYGSILCCDIRKLGLDQLRMLPQWFYSAVLSLSLCNVILSLYAIVKVDQLDYVSLLVITISYKFYPSIFYLNVSRPAFLNYLYAQNMGAWGGEEGRRVGISILKVLIILYNIVLLSKKPVSLPLPVFPFFCYTKRAVVIWFCNVLITQKIVWKHYLGGSSLKYFVSYGYTSFFC